MPIDYRKWDSFDYDSSDDVTQQLHSPRQPKPPGIQRALQILGNTANAEGSLSHSRRARGERALPDEIEYCALKSDTDSVVWWIDNDPSGHVDSTGSIRGYSLLMTASFTGNVNLVEALLKRSAALDDQNLDGYTALMLASMKGHANVVQCLLDAGANAALGDLEGTTTVQWAEINGHAECANIIKTKLLIAKSTTEQSDTDGTVPASELPASETDEQRALSKAVVNLAANEETTRVMNWINAGGHVNATTDDGRTLLMAVATAECGCTLSLMLIKRGATIDIQDDTGRTALMIATAHGNSFLVDTLLSEGANAALQCRSSYGQETALRLAERLGHLKCVSEFNKRELTLDVLKATVKGDTSTVKIWLARGGNINAVYKDLEIHLVPLKHIHGLTCNTPCDGGTLLILASCCGQQSLVSLLLEKRAAINVQDCSGVSALMLAATNGHPDIVQVLLNAGADTALRDVKGQTARQMADESSPWILRDEVDVCLCLLSEAALQEALESGALADLKGAIHTYAQACGEGSAVLTQARRRRNELAEQSRQQIREEKRQRQKDEKEARRQAAEAVKAARRIALRQQEAEAEAARIAVARQIEEQAAHARDVQDRWERARQEEARQAGEERAARQQARRERREAQILAEEEVRAAVAAREAQQRAHHTWANREYSRRLQLEEQQRAADQVRARRRLQEAQEQEAAQAAFEVTAAAPRAAPDDAECCICLAGGEMVQLEDFCEQGHWLHSACARSWRDNCRLNNLEPHCPTCQRVWNRL